MIKVSENIAYIPSSGLFVYTKISGKCKVGSNAGHLCQATKKSGGISYIKVVIGGKRELAHRVAAAAMGFDISGMVVDHINGNTVDNRSDNLRVVTSAENNKNLAKNRRTKTGINGVYVKNGRFYARITVNKENIHLGVFDNIFDAACVRKSALNDYDFHKNHGRCKDTNMQV